MSLTLLLLFLSSAFFLSEVKGNTSTKVNTLVSTLLNGYDKRTRPVKDQQSTLSIDVSFYLSIVNDVDEVTEKLVTTGYLYLTWTDQNLAWDSTTNDIDWIYLNQVGKEVCFKFITKCEIIEIIARFCIIALKLFRHGHDSGQNLFFSF